MIIPANITNKTIGVLGLSRSGLASLDALLAAGAQVYAYDDHVSPEMPDAVMHQHYDEWPWDDMDLMVISPGIPQLYPEPHPAAAKARAKNLPIISDIELMMMGAPKAKIVGITGTNGKSTIVSLIDHILRFNGMKTALGGNIGSSAVGLDDPGDDSVIILELSSYQLEIAPSLTLDAGGVINITPDHLDRHGGWDGYVAAKSFLAKSVKKEGLLVLGDDAVTASLKDYSDAAIKLINADDAPDLSQCTGLAGPHNALNATMAIAIAQSLGLSMDGIIDSLPHFNGLPHRMEAVGAKGQIRFINDSKATNGEAAAEALKSFDDIYWIAGGTSKEDGLGPALDVMDNVRAAYLIGASAEMFAEQIGMRCPYQVLGTMDRAVREAFDDAIKEDREATILLSPAAASFDQFKSFEHRGDTFCRIVDTLTASVGEAHHV